MQADHPTQEQPDAQQSRTEGTGGKPQKAVAREDQEREAAWRRAETRQRERAAGLVADAAIRARPARATGGPAFAALADNVRDYAIFLMNPDGVITYWGEGARLIKWWTIDEAEGAHLRLLYPPGGSEDGAAEQHLRDAAEHGEYT